MARRGVEEPVTVKKSFTPNDDATRTTHPAFGQIRVSKVSGRANLYGSDFSHQNFVTLEVTTSELMRNLSHDWHFPGKHLISLSMSEAQWATFVSSFGSGSGVPCTLEYVSGMGELARLPDPDIKKQYAEEAKESMAVTLERVKDLRGKMEAATSKLSKKAREELMGPIDDVISTIACSLPFIKESFDKHIEDSIEKAKVEVNAYMTNEVMRAGLEVLRKPEAKLIESVRDTIYETPGR